ncbi:hypothetical protein G6F56_012227 [Rhizopus delemar]|nr:hypothetical protein G6F56_012227 [Rhizopus delemar]
MQSPFESAKNEHLSDDSYKILKHIYQFIHNDTLKIKKFSRMQKRELLMNVCGITEHAAKKVIHMFNNPSEASENKTIGRPRRPLTTEYSSAVEEIILYNNEKGQINTVRRTMKMLEESYHMKVSYSILLRDMHALGFKYQKGIRRNILHNSYSNMLYGEFYVKERLANIDGKFNPNCPEVFLDESYCHVDHSAANTWVRPRGIVNESGRKPMLVIFAAFIVFKEGHGRKAEVIKDSVNVWPVKGSTSRINDYHGYFDAEKFERLFETICHVIQYYGPCIIHMDGASYHKRRINSVPTSSTKKDEIVTWFLQNNLLLPQDNQRGD